jgi:hypothetical protein
MILPPQKEKILGLLGISYSRKVAAYLEEKGITTKNGTPHSRAFIRQVMNGIVGHEEIEAAIFELVTIKKAEEKKRDLLLNNI